MIILHVADLHFTNQHDLLEDIVKCTNYLLDVARSTMPDMAIVAGDVFDERVALDSPAAKCAITFVIRLANICPVLILQGTESHDRGMLHIFGSLRAKHKIHIVGEMKQIVLKDGLFVDDANPKIPAQAVFSCLPPICKANIADKNMPAQEMLRDIFQGWVATAQCFDAPHIFVGHISVMGAEYNSGIQAMDDTSIPMDILKTLNADYYALGHLHKHQRWDNVCYPGSITRMDFGEEKYEKGFMLVDLSQIKPGNRADQKAYFFKPVPARKMLTIDLGNIDDVNNFTVAGNQGPTEYLVYTNDGAFIRLRFSVSEENIHRKDIDVFINTLKQYAKSVQVERTVIPKTRQRAEGISRLLTLEDKVKKWGDVVGVEITDRIVGKIKILEGT